jgi:Cu(I)/Ag(I) efflux system membrane fusion protein/cobalt-zinc-cadmium efflux system membrane fusion protein
LTLVALAIGLLLGGRYLSPTSEGDPRVHNHDGEQEATLWSCGMHPEVISDEPGNCPICGMKLTPMRSAAEAAAASSGERKIAYWQAPMDPTYTSDKPGKSPMGMDLVPVYEDEAAGWSEGAITIDPVTVQNMGIRTEMVERRDLSRVIRTFGHLDYSEENIYLVNTKISGWIEKLYVNTTGEIVKKGQPLLTLYSPELVSTQEEYLLAVGNWNRLKDSPNREPVEGARRLLEASRKRLNFWDIPEVQIEELERSGVTSRTMTINSPANGVVMHKNALQGGHVKTGEDLFRIADISTIWVIAHIYEYELPWVKVGQEAVMTLPYQPGVDYRGRIDYVYPYLDREARDVRIRVVFSNPTGANGGYELKPDMYSEVTVNAPVRDNVLAIPSEAVIRSGKRNLVFIDRGDGTFLPREVRLGVEGGDGLIEALDGVAAGERIVVSAQFLLDSESNLQEAVRKMLQARVKKSTATAAGEEHETMEKAHEHAHEMPVKAELAGERSYYVCPMDEDGEVVAIAPGECPKCGMDLVPYNPAGEGGESG